MMIQKIESIDSFAEYGKLAKRTLPDLGSLEMNILHMVLGMETEVGEALDPLKKKIAYGKELDIVNLGEEIADILWYAANTFNLLEEELPSLLQLRKQKENRISKEFFVILNATNITLSVKLVNIFRLISLEVSSLTVYPIAKEDRGISKTKLERIILFCNIACELLEINIYDILKNNINKLIVRYPEKFTNENALNRDLEAERKELEN